MQKLFVYIDNSNLFIEGQRLSAVRRGYATDIYDAQDRKVFDFQWNIDYGKLHKFLTEQGTELAAVKLWGSIPPHDSFWKMVEQSGFEVRTFQRSASGREKKVDVAIAHQITKDAYSGVVPKQEGVIVLVAGDRDFVPVVEDLRAEGFTFHVVFWDQAARELKEAASYFISLDSRIDALRNGGPQTA